MSMLTKEGREEIRHKYQAESIADASVIRRLLDTIDALEAERDDWKITAQNLAKTLQGMNEKYFDLLESVPQAGVRSSIRRRLNRFLMEVVR